MIATSAEMIARATVPSRTRPRRARSAAARDKPYDGRRDSAHRVSFAERERRADEPKLSTRRHEIARRVRVPARADDAIHEPSAERDTGTVRQTKLRATTIADARSNARAPQDVELRRTSPSSANAVPKPRARICGIGCCRASGCPRASRTAGQAEPANPAPPARAARSNSRAARARPCRAARSSAGHVKLHEHTAHAEHEHVEDDEVIEEPQVSQRERARGDGLRVRDRGDQHRDPRRVTPQISALDRECQNDPADERHEDLERSSDEALVPRRALGRARAGASEGHRHSAHVGPKITHRERRAVATRRARSARRATSSRAHDAGEERERSIGSRACRRCWFDMGTPQTNSVCLGLTTNEIASAAAASTSSIAMNATTSGLHTPPPAEARPDRGQVDQAGNHERDRHVAEDDHGVVHACESVTSANASNTQK